MKRFQTCALACAGLGAALPFAPLVRVFGFASLLAALLGILRS